MESSILSPKQQRRRLVRLEAPARGRKFSNTSFLTNEANLQILKAEAESSVDVSQETVKQKYDATEAGDLKSIKAEENAEVSQPPEPGLLSKPQQIKPENNLEWIFSYSRCNPKFQQKLFERHKNDLDFLSGELMYRKILDALPPAPPTVSSLRKKNLNNQGDYRPDMSPLPLPSGSPKPSSAVLTSTSWSISSELVSYVRKTYGAMYHKTMMNESQCVVYTFEFDMPWQAVYFFRFGCDNERITNLIGPQFTIEVDDDTEKLIQNEESHPPKMWDDPKNYDKSDPLSRMKKIHNGGGTEKSYFRSYGRWAIHRTMLQDEVRTKAYRNAIEDSKVLFMNRTVLDVGCGTGILSLFAAKAGAKKVFAVDNSTILRQTEQIVRRSGFSKVITVIKGTVESLELPVDHVDIIVSEWMGYFLLYEKMLDSVLFARDKWLRPGGLMFPTRATLFVSGFYDPDFVACRTNRFGCVWEADMAPLADPVRRVVTVEDVQEKRICTNYFPVLNLDLRTCSTSDLSFSTTIRLTAQGPCVVQALVVHFDVTFPAPPGKSVVTLSTAPAASKCTHWKHCVLLLKDDITLDESPGQSLFLPAEDAWGLMQVRPLQNILRGLDIRVQLSRADHPKEPEPNIFCMR